MKIQNIRANHVFDAEFLIILDSETKYLEMGKKKLSIKLIKLDARELCFDLINSDFPFANAIRRILLSEVPTMAIEKVHLYSNTSELSDFALCQRLGLVPIKADAQRFQTNQNDEESENSTIKLTLQVQCPPDHSGNLHVYSDSIRWCPIGRQSRSFRTEPIKPVDDDILLMKLAPSQKIDAILYCHKGIGKDHAKYSPVAACYYCFLTEFRFAQDEPLTREEFEQLKIYFPRGYLDFDQIDENGHPLVLNNRFNKKDFIFKSCPSLAKKIIFETKRDTLSFTVETVGIIEPPELVLRSIDVLKSKCTDYLKRIHQAMAH